ncbi:MAG TPA: phasin family protein [Burkholderiaceae bacterium]|jgi:phasin family protein|nr:phasin family protein [Burkholderiaceae bacterium]
MFTIPEQFSTATRTNFESQLALFLSLTNKAFEGVEKVVDLNLNMAKTSIEESNAAAKQLLVAKDLQEFFTLGASQTQPNTEKAIAYTRDLASILSTTQAEFTKTAEEQIAEANRTLIAFVDDVTKNAPVGSETAMTLMKSMIGNANAGYEQLSKNTKQAVETFEAGVNTAASQFSQATPKAAGKSARK